MYFVLFAFSLFPVVLCAVCVVCVVLCRTHWSLGLEGKSTLGLNTEAKAHVLDRDIRQRTVAQPMMPSLCGGKIADGLMRAMSKGHPK